MKKKVSRLLLATSMCFAISPIAQATGVYAPYVDMTLYPTPVLDNIGVQQGIQQFTLAFVVSGNNGCTPSWGGVQSIGSGNASDLLTSIANSVKNYRAKGGEVAVAFGGANGVPLQQACTSTAALKTAYQTVIDTYGATHIDFDIEGGAQEDTASLTRNFQAVAQLQSAMATKGTPLHVTLTLPVMPYGLTPDGVSVVNAALTNKVSIDGVNVMAMDYGTANGDMGSAATQAASGLYSQLDAAYKAIGQTKTNAQLWQLVGVTPMIGMNDTQGETFTAANAKSLLSFAQTNNLGLLANWSVGRDKSCPNNGAYTAADCSGVVQKPYDFANTFRQVNGHWGTGVTQDPTYAGGDSGSGGVVDGMPWNASQTYLAGNTVTYNGGTYKAGWWTQGDVPGQSSVWQQTSGPAQTWSAGAAYSGGTCVMYNKAKYCAQWWTQGDVPSNGGVWVKS
ncbi:MAG TPA: chitinase [Paraburkholderia sp.]|jgi:chitinase|nr:chitinase [Paraburkholderia sp.]